MGGTNREFAPKSSVLQRSVPNGAAPGGGILHASVGRRTYVLGGAQSDFARNLAREGLGLDALVREVVDDALTDAALDARTATALAVMLEEEAVCGLAPERADALASQLGVTSLLPTVRAFAARWASEHFCQHPPSKAA